MNNKNQIIRILTLSFTASPVLFAAAAVSLGLNGEPKPEPNYELIRMLSIVNMLFFAVSFAAAGLVANFVARSQPKETNVLTWFLIRGAVHEGSALLGCVVFFLAATEGILKSETWVWVNLLPTFALAVQSAARFPTDDIIAEKQKELIA